MDRANLATVPPKDESDLEKSVPPLQHTYGFIEGLVFRIDPPPPKESIEDADYTPEMTAGWFSLLTFGWMNSLMVLGYARPLEASDLPKLQEHRSSVVIATAILNSFEARRKSAQEYNARLANGEIKPPLSVWLMSRLRGDRDEQLRRWREEDGKKQPSLTWAINDSVKWWFCPNNESSPCEGEIIFEGLPAPSVVEGLGYVFAFISLQLVALICQRHFHYRGASSGVLVRGGLITAIYSRSLRLTTCARASLPNGRLLNHISTDVSRIDFCCGFFHISWTAPIQIVICLCVLLGNLGPSALVGFAVFIILIPIQGKVMSSLFESRRRTMEWTDKRAKLLQELLGGIKLIKFFAWESPILNRIAGYREREMSYVRKMLLLRAANVAVALTIPALASVVAFLLYAGSGHELTPAVVFSSLTSLQLMRLPLMMLPVSLNAIIDARNAIGRLQECFTAELISEEIERDPDLKYAIEIENASFTWDSPPPDEHKTKKKGFRSKAIKEGDLFKLKNIDLKIPRGQLVAIVGAVGSGKTSLLQGLIGDMRKTEGSVRFGGSVAYCSQSAWIQNATIRDNICFGRPFEAEHYWKVVRDACLEADLDVLPNGDMTEVGERGISLSGGQKQRVNICRALYSGSDILIFDDPLSALDTHVGESVFNKVFLNNTSGTTRVLITHSLHSLPDVDYIYFMDDGEIIEHGTFDEMIAMGGDFALTFDGFVMENRRESKNMVSVDVEDPDAAEKALKRRSSKGGAKLMQAEERNVGAMNVQVYKQYFQSGNGKTLLPAMVVSVVLMQTAIMLSSYWLVWWQDRRWPRPQGFYACMWIYAMLVIAQALTGLLVGTIVTLIVNSASRRLHHDAISRVMYSPMSFFETTPVGRIVNRFSKDIDIMDNLLADSLRMVLNTFSVTLGATILISVVFPLFLITVTVVSVFYALNAAVYRASARETKRLDAILRSLLYSHFSESLSGIAAIRAYKAEDRFLKDNRDRVDHENRAYWVLVTSQQWLGLRFDFLGVLLTLTVSLLAVCTRFTVPPTQIGLTFSCIFAIQQACDWMVRQLAEVENHMNSVERIIYYSHELEQEPPHKIPEAKPAAPWPSEGKLEIKDAVLRYRPKLPLILKGLSMTVQGGEKIGIIGRTGGGKSSIMVALFRIVELVSGSITIDGVDISKIGLDDVRNAISIIPQDATLFSGTLRSNLDPFGRHDDARLWYALKRSHLCETLKRISLRKKAAMEAATGIVVDGGESQRFTLDSPIDEEGANLSVGHRSLVCLARALVRDSRILVLDEATASVDYDTDRRIQETIATEFYDRTILCIAHRLHTIISYDRVCVMDKGKIAEFDTPEALYAQRGVFRAMCEHSRITLEDIRRARKEREARDELMHFS
ncbi:ABC transporter [Russula brevipes]|nr:ABC transporter [Russula brevipes]